MDYRDFEGTIAGLVLIAAGPEGTRHLVAWPRRPSFTDTFKKVFFVFADQPDESLITGIFVRSGP